MSETSRLDTVLVCDGCNAHLAVFQEDTPYLARQRMLQQYAVDGRHLCPACMFRTLIERIEKLEATPPC